MSLNAFVRSVGIATDIPLSVFLGASFSSGLPLVTFEKTSGLIARDGSPIFPARLSLNASPTRQADALR